MATNPRAVGPFTLAVAAQIREERQRRGWEQTRLGLESGLSQSAISRIEGGKTAIDMEQVDALALAFGMKAEELIAASRKYEQGAPPADPVYLANGKLNPLNTWTRRTSSEHAEELEADPDD